MEQFERISADEARNDTQKGAVLVNGYDDPAEFEKTRVSGAVAYPEFAKREASLPKDKEVVFYCDCPNDKTAVGRASDFTAKGFTNVKVVDGGFKALSALGNQAQSAQTAQRM